MEWKVGDGVRVDQRLGGVHRVLTNEIAVLFDGDACEYFYPKDARYLTKVVLSDDLGAVVYISTAKPEPLPTPPAPVVDPRPCQRHYYGFKDESCTCQRGCASSA